MSDRRQSAEGYWWLLPIVALAAARGLWAPDEPRYAQIAREAFDTREFLVLHLNGDLYPDKPPLVYWLSGLCGSLTGWNELALRVPSILATAGSAWIATRLARRWLGERTASLVPLCLLGCAMSFWMGGRLQLDPLLGLCVLAAVERLARDGTRRELVVHAAWAGAFAGLGALVKGPVAWLHVGLALVAWRCAPRAARFAPPRGWLAWASLAALAVLPVATWAACASWREPRLWKPLFFGQHLGRISDEAPHQGPPWEHLVQMPLWLLPTTFFVGAGLLFAWRAWKRARAGDAVDAGLVRVALWLALTVVVFSAMPAKRELYLLPVYPAAALLAAHALASGEALRGATRATAAVVGSLGAGAAIVPWFVDATRPFAATFLAVAVPLLLAAASGWRARDAVAGARVLAQGVGGALLLAAAFVVPHVDASKSPAALARSIAALPPSPSRVAFVGVQPEGYRFYAGVPGVKIAGTDAEVERGVREAIVREGAAFVLVARDRDLDRLPADVRAALREVARARVGARDVLVLVLARE